MSDAEDVAAAESAVPASTTGPDGHTDPGLPVAQPDASAEPDLPQPDLPPHDLPTHDPTGLDLARQLATGVGRPAAPKQKRTRKRRPDTQRSGRQDPELLGSALAEVIADAGWERELAVQDLFGRWALIVGQAIGDHSEPVSLEGKVLTVRAESTAWATQLRGVAPQLVAVLNEHLGQGTVERVYVKGPDAPSWSHGSRSVKGGRGPRDTYG